MVVVALPLSGRRRVGHRDGCGRQTRDRAALELLDLAFGGRPLHVLGAAEQLGGPSRQRGDLACEVCAEDGWIAADPLGAAVAEAPGLGSALALRERRAEAGDRVDGDRVALAGDGIGGERDTCGLCRDERLDDHGGGRRRPRDGAHVGRMGRAQTAEDGGLDGFGSPDAEDGAELPGHGTADPIFGHRRRAHRERAVSQKLRRLPERLPDLVRERLGRLLRDDPGGEHEAIWHRQAGRLQPSQGRALSSGPPHVRRAVVVEGQEPRRPWGVGRVHMASWR